MLNRINPLYNICKGFIFYRRKIMAFYLEWEEIYKLKDEIDRMWEGSSIKNGHRLLEKRTRADQSSWYAENQWNYMTPTLVATVTKHGDNDIRLEWHVQ